MILPETPHEVHPFYNGIGRIGPSNRWDFITGAEAPPGRQCLTWSCRGERAVRGRVCNKCYSRLRRLNDPLRAAYDALKTNSKRRGKIFDLTFSQFRQFAEENGYMDGKGRCIGALHIDRKNPLLGYTWTNIQVLECSENSSKGASEDRLRHYNSQPLQNELEDVGF